MRSPCPDPAEMERGSARALQGHEQAKDELKLGTGGAGRLGLIPTNANLPWDATKSLVQGQPFPSPAPLGRGFRARHPAQPQPRGGMLRGREGPSGAGTKANNELGRKEGAGGRRSQEAAGAAAKGSWEGPCSGPLRFPIWA